MIEVTCALIIQDGYVLVTQRSEEMPHPLKWEFPGGKVREGETPESSIVREILEELSVKIGVESLLPSVRYTYPNQKIKLIPFICSIIQGKIKLSEHSDYRWVSFEDLDAVDWLDADVEVVKEFRKKLGQQPSR